MGNELALKLDNVKKKYRLGVIGGGTLQGDIQSWWARIRGKEDPNTKIGAEIDTKKGSFMALNGISFEVKKGERLGIIGGNGAGKSTTLKILSRVTAPTEGEVYINGRISSMLEVGTGFHPELTGRENIYLNGAILGMSKAEVDRKIEDIIEFSECRQFIDTPVKRYSSGMYVKLAFSVAAHLDSEIMIMDEVLAVGDMKFQQKCLNKMKEVSEKEGRTVLYVSHNMNTIRQLCDRCVVLEKGKLIYDGEVEQAINIYSGRNNKIALSYDCRNSAREDIGDSAVHINWVELLDVKEPIIYNNKVKISVNFDSKMRCKTMAFRTIFFSETHRPIGMAASHPVVEVEEGNNIVEFEMLLPMLSTGRYFGRIVFYEVDSAGGEAIHDVVNDAFAFYKDYKDVQNETSMRWNENVWGSVVFDTIKVL